MSTEISTELATADALASVGSDLDRAIEGLKSGKGVMSTFTGTDFESKVQVVQAMTNALPLDENMGKVINLRNVVVQSVELTDAQTGELITAPRIILVDEDGTAYAAVSKGIFSSLKNFFAVLGTPESWGQPLPVVASKAKGKVGSYFTLTVATSK